jgi:hypothetical protein
LLAAAKFTGNAAQSIQIHSQEQERAS